MHPKSKSNRKLAEYLEKFAQALKFLHHVEGAEHCEEASLRLVEAQDSIDKAHELIIALINLAPDQEHIDVKVAKLYLKQKIFFRGS